MRTPGAGLGPTGGATTVAVVLVLVAALMLLVVAFRPICVPIPDEDLKSFNVPIEQRTDRDFYLKVFQKRDGHWCQCKTWISRQLFF